MAFFKNSTESKSDGGYSAQEFMARIKAHEDLSRSILTGDKKYFSSANSALQGIDSIAQTTTNEAKDFDQSESLTPSFRR